MTDWHVDNSMTGWIYNSFDQSEEVTYSPSYDDRIEDVGAGLPDGQTIQLDGFTYRLTYNGGGEYILDRAHYNAGGGPVTMYYSNNTGGSSDPFANINEVLAQALAGDTVNIKRTSNSYYLSESDQIPEPLEPGTGDIKNKPIIIEGYHTTVGDMRYSGEYYQSALDAHISGAIDTTKKVVICSGFEADNLLKLDGSGFVIFRNLYFNECNSAIIDLANTPRNVVFENCFFAESDFVMSGVCNDFTFVGCYVKSMFYGDSGYTINSSGLGMKFVGNVIDIGNYTKYGCASGDANEPYSNGLHYGNLIIGGLYPILCRAGDMIMNNTFYDGVKGIRVGFGSSSAGKVTISNNIVMGKDVSSHGILVEGSYGTPIINDNNCFWSLAGAMTNPVSNTVSGGGTLSLGPNSIEADPLFTSDYRPKNPQVLRDGYADIYGNTGQIGAMLSEHKFQRRSVAGRSTSKKFFR